MTELCGKKAHSLRCGPKFQHRKKPPMASFEVHRRYAPKVPDATCPAIDSAIGSIDSAIDTLRALTDRSGDLESLRSANDSLRELAQYWREAAESLASEVDGLVDSLNAAEWDRDEAQSELYKLQQVAA